MGRHWSELGTGRRFKLVLYLVVAALFVYFVFRLGMALARRFRAIQGVYQVGAVTHTPAARAPHGTPGWDWVEGALERERITLHRCE